jgi:hypothetical protein
MEKKMNDLLEMIDFLGELDYDLHANMSGEELIAIREKLHRYKDKLESEVEAFESSLEQTRFYSLTTEQSDTIL